MNSSTIPSDSKPEPSFEMADRHLTYLDDSTETFTFQTFDDSPKKNKALARVLTGTLEACWKDLVALNKQGAGVFVTVNGTNGNGRKKGDVTIARAVWQEDDDKGGAKDLPLEPQLIIESSPGKYHRYMMTSFNVMNGSGQDPEKVREWEAVQQRMVDDYGSDPNAKDLSRVLRLAGFCHQKASPHLVSVIHESATGPYDWEVLTEAIPPVSPKGVKTGTGNSASGDKLSVREAIAEILRADNFHGNLTRLAAHYAAKGMELNSIIETLQGFMHASVEIGSLRWQDRYNDIPRTVHSGLEKFSPAQEAPFDSVEPVDVFADRPVPEFPIDALPQALQACVAEQSQSSGFDPGAYAFAYFMTAANAIDHRAKLSLSATMKVPPNAWGGLVADSGGGKSPVMDAATSFYRNIDAEIVAESQRRYAQFKEAMAQTSKGEPRPEQPPWKQRIANDTTTEALGNLLEDNPEGMLLLQDEITEFIGRMDAYSGGGAGGKDRGAYLRAYGGGRHAINRKHKQVPLIIENFSVGIIAGIQPEKLAELFKKSGCGSDGLYQRFLLYMMRPAGKVDYQALPELYTDANARMIFNRLQEWTDDLTFLNHRIRIDESVKPEMEKYHNEIRNLVARTSAKRFAEHLDKFPGFLGRTAFALHCIECAATSEFRSIVSLGTFERALCIMKVFYRHSEAVYAILDSGVGNVMDLVKSAAEAILAKEWHEFNRGDLTRNATYWQGESTQATEHAIDYLIELGWVRDVTPLSKQGKPGRRSAGKYRVNPQVFERFQEHVARVKDERAGRYAAIKEIAS